MDDVEVKNYVANAELMVFPTLYEGFGIPPLEAMACGCPVLVSDIPVTREVCSDAALYFNPNNISELSKLIEEVLNKRNQNDLIISKGIERSKFYSWESASNKTVNIFSELFSKMDNLK